MSSSSTLRALAVLAVVAAAAAAAATPADLCAKALALPEPRSTRVQNAMNVVCDPAAERRSLVERRSLAESEYCDRASSSPPVLTAHHPRY